MGPHQGKINAATERLLRPRVADPRAVRVYRWRVVAGEQGSHVLADDLVAPAATHRIRIRRLDGAIRNGRRFLDPAAFFARLAAWKREIDLGGIHVVEHRDIARCHTKPI